LYADTIPGFEPNLVEQFNHKISSTAVMFLTMLEYKMNGHEKKKWKLTLGVMDRKGIQHSAYYVIVQMNYQHALFTTTYE
jgi:hypothetical protein